MEDRAPLSSPSPAAIGQIVLTIRVSPFVACGGGGSLLRTELPSKPVKLHTNT